MDAFANIHGNTRNALTHPNGYPDRYADAVTELNLDIYGDLYWHSHGDTNVHSHTRGCDHDADHVPATVSAQYRQWRAEVMIESVAGWFLYAALVAALVTGTIFFIILGWEAWKDRG